MEAIGAATWNSSWTGSVGRDNSSAIRDRVKDTVDEFINAYLSVNPRSTGKRP